MRLLPTSAYPKTRVLDHRTDLTDPHVTIPDVAKALPYNRVVMVANREEVGEEVAAEGTPLAEGVTKMMRQMMI